MIIYSHGLGANHSMGKNYIDYFLDKNIAFFTFDFIGGGHTIKSDGKTTEMSVLTEVDDLKIVVQFIQMSKEINISQLILFGESQGGLVSSLLASKEKNKIDGIILHFPAFVITDNLHQTFGTINNVPNKFFYKNWINLGLIYPKDVWN